MSGKTDGDKRKDKLKSALRDNLRKRKAQARKISGDEGEGDMKLRGREFAAKTKE